MFMTKEFGEATFILDNRVTKTCRVVADQLKLDIKDFLYSNSPLRNEFQIRPLDEGELPLFNSNASLIIDEDKKSIIETSGKRACAMLFELSCMPGIPYSDLESKKFKDIKNMFLEKASTEMLKQETEIYNLLINRKDLIVNGKGVFIIRVDIQALPALSEKEMGFSIFENVGAMIAGI